MNRRMLLGLTLATMAPPKSSRAADSAISIQDLWPGAPPGGAGVTATEHTVLRSADPDDTAYMNVTKPWLMLRRPVKPNGGAVLVIPGGGYVRVAVSKAGGEIDAWLAGLGYTVFTMDYRLPADGWAAGPDVALQDAQRAIRLVRSRAGELGFDPARVAVMGFSAGGHVAGLLATRFAEQSYAPVDAVDALPARPEVAALMYPVITMTEPYAHKGSLKQLFGDAPTDVQRAHSSIEQHVPADAPPTFVGGTTDDPAVAMQNAVMIFEALKAAGITSELHLYEGRTHGFPLRDKDGRLLPWGPVMLDFLQRHGLDKAA